WTGQGGEKQEKTEWHRVVCWNNKGFQLADLAEKYMKKGDRIYVEGRIEYRTWEDREKQTRYTTEIIAREVLLLSSRGGGGRGGGRTRRKRRPRRPRRGNSPRLTSLPRARPSGPSLSFTSMIRCSGPRSIVSIPRSSTTRTGSIPVKS